MPLLTEHYNFGIFLLVTVALGGGAAWLAGRAIAQTWRPWWHLVFYMLILGLAVRFIHFALFEGRLLSLYYYAVDSAVAILIATLGFRITRARQMARQYRFLRRREGGAAASGRASPGALESE
jgi:hypothetical protein